MNKRRVCLVAWVVAILGMCIVPALAVNLVTNGSFETADTNGADWWLPGSGYGSSGSQPMPAGWASGDSYAVGIWGYGTVEGMTAKDGDQVGYLAKNSYLQNTASPIQNGITYRLSSYVVSDTAETDVIEMKIMAIVPNPLAPTESQYDIYYTLSSKKFTPRTIAQGWGDAPLALDFSVTDQSRYVTVTYGGSTLENVDIVGRPLVVTLEGFDRNNYCYFDDLQLCEVDNLVTNGSFETADTNGADWWLPGSGYGSSGSQPMPAGWVNGDSYAVGIWGYGTVEELMAKDGDQVGYLAKNSYLQNTASPIQNGITYRLSSYVVSDTAETDVVEMKIMTKVPNPLAPTESQYDIYHTLASKKFSPRTIAQGWGDAPLALDFSVTDQSRYVTVTYGGSTLENVDIVGRPLVVTLEGFDRNNYCYFDSVKLKAANPMVATPAFSPSSKTIYVHQSVTVSCDAPNATIRYTDNGSDPTETNGTLVASGDSISVAPGTTLKARAWATGMTASDIQSATYAVAGSFNHPATISPAGSMTVDGSLSDWTGAEWIPLDQPYDGGGAGDVAQAFYAVQWSENKVYVAVKVQDLMPSFTNGYGTWNGRDAIEVYLHASNQGGVYYSNYQNNAQQYGVGIMSSNHNQVWTSLTNLGEVPVGLGFQAAGHVDTGNWIYYEVAMTPFENYGEYTGETTVPATLQIGDVIGLDVCVVGHDGSNYTGMKAENTVSGKSVNWSYFGLHKLTVATPKIPGDANGDRMVDVGDLGILAANYGGSGKTWAHGDFNGDGLVDVGDLGILAAHYGEGSKVSLDFSADYAKIFVTTEADETDNEEISSSICSGMGLPLIAGLALMGLMLAKLEE